MTKAGGVRSYDSLSLIVAPSAVVEQRPWQSQHYACIQREPGKVSPPPPPCTAVVSCPLPPCRLGLQYVDLYLMHSAMGGKTVETWDTMIELKEKDLIRCA